MSHRFGLGATALAAFFLIASPARATDQDFQLWPGFQARVRFTESVSANALLQLRFGDDASELRAGLVRTWLGVRPRPWLELAAGYDFFPRIEPDYIWQHRVWPQATLFKRWSRLSANNRTRLELRFVEGVDPVGVSLRNRIGLAHPLGRSSWYAVGADEFFFLLNDAGPFESGFLENRAFLGLGHRLGAQLRFESGYSLRYISLPGEDAIQHTLVFTLLFDRRLDP